MFCSWTFRKKWAVTALASAYTFLSPVASAMTAPAAPDIAAEFHIRSSVEIVLTVSIFVLAYGAEVYHIRDGSIADASEIFSVRTTVVCSPFRNLREGTFVAVHKHPFPRWVELVDVARNGDSRIKLSLQSGMRFRSEQNTTLDPSFYGWFGRGCTTSRKHLTRNR